MKKIDTKTPFIPDGFKLISNTDLGEIDIKKIKLYQSKEQKSGEYIKGEDLLKEDGRSNKKGKYGWL